ncbi:MAG TPA: DUF87 domain-containing protein, partial [Thermoplasmata archaeon]|nr:DUF87 domain-containing protein [Thermoplasmata archaeon]
LDDASPVVLDRWSQSSYSWGLFGSTGSGKSFAASLIALRSRWMRPEVELFVLDPLGEFAPLAEALGGDVVRLGSPGGPHLNPLDPGGAAEGWTDKAGRIGSFLRTLFPSLTDVESATLDGALASIGSDRARPPILSDLVQAVAARRGAPPRLATLLEVFRTGSLAYLDGPSTLTWEGRPIVFDLSNVLEAHLPFHLAYLLDAIYARLQRSPKPKLVVVDEAHLLARHPGTAEFLDRLVRHVRHFGSGLLIVSQNPDDFLGSEAGRSLLRNLRATVLLHLAEVSQATRAFFGLTEAEAEWLPRARLPKEAGYSEGLLRLGPAHLPMAIVASTPEYELLTGRPIGPGE